MATSRACLEETGLVERREVLVGPCDAEVAGGVVRHALDGGPRPGGAGSSWRIQTSRVDIHPALEILADSLPAAVGLEADVPVPKPSSALSAKSGRPRPR